MTYEEHRTSAKIQQPSKLDCEKAEEGLVTWPIPAWSCFACEGPQIEKPVFHTRHPWGHVVM